MFSPDDVHTAWPLALGGVLHREEAFCGPRRSRARFLKSAAGTGQARSAVVRAIFRGMQSSSHGKVSVGLRKQLS